MVWIYSIGVFGFFVVLAFIVHCERDAKQQARDCEGFRKWFPLLDDIGGYRLQRALSLFCHPDSPSQYLQVFLIVLDGDNEKALTFDYAKEDTGVSLGCVRKTCPDPGQKSSWTVTVSHATIWSALDKMLTEMIQEDSWPPQDEENDMTEEERPDATHHMEALNCGQVSLTIPKGVRTVCLEFAIDSDEYSAVHKNLQFYSTELPDKDKQVLRPMMHEDVCRQGRWWFSIQCPVDRLEEADKVLNDYILKNYNGQIVELLYTPENSEQQWHERDVKERISSFCNVPCYDKLPPAYFSMYCMKSELKEGRKQFYDFVYEELRRQAQGSVDKVNELNAEYKRVTEG